MQTSRPPSSEDIEEAIQRLAVDIAKAHSDTTNLAIIGIAVGGVELGKRLTSSISKQLGREVPFGTVDISFHRDDISSNPVPNIQPFANLPFDVEGKNVILVDDVIFSGRSIRAALNEVFDQGRPKHVSLAVLVDRGGRSLPINPDFVGLTLKVGNDQRVEVALGDQVEKPHSITITS